MRKFKRNSNFQIFLFRQKEFSPQIIQIVFQNIPPKIHFSLIVLQFEHVDNIFDPFSNRIEWNAMDLNTEQKSAIVNILKQTSYPHPYLLFGPPGTGKTKTLIEAIMQIIHNDNPNEFILVCATSNSACNEVALRLLGNLGADKLFRIFAKSVSFHMEDIPAALLSASNLKTAEHYYPSLQVIYQYKVSDRVTN